MDTAIKIIIKLFYYIISIIFYALVIAFNIYAFKFTNQFSDAFMISLFLINTSFLLHSFKLCNDKFF